MAIKSFLSAGPRSGVDPRVAVIQDLMGEFRQIAQANSRQSLGKVFSLESMGPDTPGYADLDADLTQLAQRVDTTLSALGSRFSMESIYPAFFDGADDDQADKMKQSLKRGFTPQQQRAATLALAMAQDPKAYLGFSLESAISGFEAVNKGLGHGSFGYLGSGTKRPSTWTLEAFQQASNQNLAQASVVFSLLATRQLPAYAAIYPICIMNPDQGGWRVTTNIPQVLENERRETTGNVFQQGRVNLAFALRKHDLLRDGATEAIPVYRVGGDEPSDKYFYKNGVTALTEEVDNGVGGKILTGWLKFGTELDLIGISQPDYQLNQGKRGFEDVLDPNISLDRILVKITATIGGTPVTEHFSFDMLRQAYSAFNKAPQGDSEAISLSQEANMLLLNENTKQWNGATSLIAGQLTGVSVRLRSNINGRIVCDTGVTEVGTQPLRIYSVKDNLTQTPVTGGSLTAVETLLADMTAVGYKLKAWMTNSVRRVTGQLTDVRQYSTNYTVAYRQPISTVRPVNDDGANDAARIQAMIQTCHTRMAGDTTTTMLEHPLILQRFISEGDSYGDTGFLFGPVSYMMKPMVTIKHGADAVDMQDLVDSLTSTNRTEDLKFALVNYVRDLASNMFTDSGLEAAAMLTYGMNPPKFVLYMITDPVIHNYMQLTGDNRLVGEKFEYQVESVQDLRMKNRMEVRFGLREAETSGAPNPFHNGATLFRNELLLSMPMVRNGAQTHELVVTPSWRVIDLMPLAISLEIKNITQVATRKNPIWNKPV